MEILLVDDDLEDADLAIEALTGSCLACRVSLVRDGEEALRFLRREDGFSNAPTPDLILLDMQMPKKDGLDVLREIQKDNQAKAIPVIVMTASRVHRVILEAEQLPVVGYLTKPVRAEQVIAVVNSLRYACQVKLEERNQ